MGGDVNYMFSRNGRRGAVTLEMVVLSVLVAVAVTVAIIVFGQTIVRSSDIADRALVGKGNNAAKAVVCTVEGYQKQVGDDTKEAMKFTEEFSDADK